MGEIAEQMISGDMCEMCGESLMCDECENVGTPMYCSLGCAKDRGATKDQVCNHDTDDDLWEPKDFDFREMAKLICAYGYKIIEINEEQKKVRFKGEGKKDLIDLWNSKKGVTMGAYNAKKRKMEYKKWCTLIGVENFITEIERHDNI